ncbi:NUDIX hydrolase [Ktedonobacter racemifer]|uniref:NUDIX hydrolase n=1 Tax=Ktedonobacter racemifer DSM 44963 TaxID=485913 RepID=D6TJK5_KTERA|nr:NUDIX hydrolase [Ktedonobacter racemifer]EFH89612.1 NUDIX hydrolase [Ktedonobacter racemifer DSM 44963]
MLSSLPREQQDEIAHLAERYGTPALHNAALYTGDDYEPLNKPDRYGEVCMVVRRKNGRLLTMKKAFYPPATFRLLTGGIHHGESIYDALLRETHEETGLEVTITQFLAIVAYQTENARKTPSFYTFAFLLDEVNGTLGAIDEDEEVESFCEIQPAELPQLAEHLEHLAHTEQRPHQNLGDWGEWGRFRAVIHRVVWDKLQSQGNARASK